MRFKLHQRSECDLTSPVQKKYFRTNRWITVIVVKKTHVKWEVGSGTLYYINSIDHIVETMAHNVPTEDLKINKDILVQHVDNKQ